jgi:hypothetical protein
MNATLQGDIESLRKLKVKELKMRYVLDRTEHLQPPRRPQAPPPGVHAGRHHQHPVHLRRRIRRNGKSDRQARGHQVQMASCSENHRPLRIVRICSGASPGACRPGPKAI